MRLRGITIPRTGKRRWRFHSYYKHPKTTQEKRLAFGLIADRLRHFLRGKRSPKVLPNVYDDIPKHQPRRSWKKFRKHQYKKEFMKIRHIYDE